MTLPDSVQRLFYRYHADRLDTAHHADVIVATVLADGALADWDWLFEVYGWQGLRDWIAVPSHAMELPPPLERFWTLILLGEAHETRRWSGGNARRVVPASGLPDWFPQEP